MRHTNGRYKERETKLKPALNKRRYSPLAIDIFALRANSIYVPCYAGTIRYTPQGARTIKRSNQYAPQGAQKQKSLANARPRIYKVSIINAH